MTWQRAIPVIVAVALLAGCTSTTRAPRSRGEGPMIRALIGERDAATIESTTAFRVETGGLVLMRSERSGAVEVSASGRTLDIRVTPGGNVGTAQDDVAIIPENGGDVRVAGVTYAGRVRVRVAMSGKLHIINVLPLETYLEGVVPHEIGNPGPEAFAAVEAQAVTARTYALGRIEDRRDEPFDVFAGVRDQVYRGRERVFRSSSAAVRDTRGIVLEHRGGTGPHVLQRDVRRAHIGHPPDVAAPRRRRLSPRGIRSPRPFRRELLPLGAELPLALLVQRQGTRPDTAQDVADRDRGTGRPGRVTRRPADRRALAVGAGVAPGDRHHDGDLRRQRRPHSLGPHARHRTGPYSPERDVRHRTHHARRTHRPRRRHRRR